MAREKLYKYFALKNKIFCYGSYRKKPLTRYGLTSNPRALIVYMIGRGKDVYFNLSYGTLQLN